MTGKEGMGFGDFKLLAALGAWLGVKMLLPIVLGASVIGAIVGIVMKMSAALREGRTFPSARFSQAPALIVMLAGPERVLGWLGWPPEQTTWRTLVRLRIRPDGRNRQRKEHRRHDCSRALAQPSSIPT